MSTGWFSARNPTHAGLILGLDNCGRTTMLFRMSQNMLIRSIPTIGINVETVRRKGWTAQLWEVGGCSEIRSLIGRYMKSHQFFIFLHDCSTPERLEDSIQELQFAVEQAIEHNCKDCFILLGKQDLLPVQSRDTLVAAISERFQSAVVEYKYRCIIRVVHSPGLSGLTGEGVDAALESIRQATLGLDRAHKVVPRPETRRISRNELIEKIAQEGTTASGVEKFWKGFLRVELPSWNHYAHLRAGYLTMLDRLSVGESILDCAEVFLQHLARLRAARPDVFRNISHKTLTVFWLLQLQYAALKYAADHDLSGYPSREDFHSILLHSPELMDPELWSEYYWKSTLFAPDARENWRQPSHKSLPAYTPARHPQKTLEKSPDSGDLLFRFALAVVQKTIDTTTRRGAIIKRALISLQSTIMKRRSVDPSIAPYSETQAYFWVQYFHAAAASLGSEHGASFLAGDRDKPLVVWDGSVSALTLDAFRTLFDITGQEWESFYSKSLWESISARMQYVNPDLKPLPNVISVASGIAMAAAQKQMLDEGIREHGAYTVPGAVELGVSTAAILEEVSVPANQATSIVKTHAELLYFLYGALIKPYQKTTDMSDSEISDLEKLRVSRGIETAMSVSGPGLEGVTQRMFWIQQFISASKRNVLYGSFDEFMHLNANLAFEGLPLVYYSEELWRSKEARDQLVPPDVTELQAGT